MFRIVKVHQFKTSSSACQTISAYRWKSKRFFTSEQKKDVLQYRQEEKKRVDDDQNVHAKKRWFQWKYVGYAAVGVMAGVVVIYAYNAADDYLNAPDPSYEKKKVVVVGGGWASVGFLHNIDTRYYDVTVVSPRNYFLFTPLLPSVTVGTVEPRSITESLHYICLKVRGKIPATYYEASCIDLDPQNNVISCVAKQDVVDGSKEFKLKYDYLILAVGAVNNTFGTPGVYENCFFLKEVDDAVKIRRKIVDCFEAANVPIISEEERDRLLHFVVVGGGPNGVEFAAELRDHVTDNLSKVFPNIVGKVQITLVELLDHILSTYDAKISDFTEKHFKRNDIDVRTQYQVVAVNTKEVITKKIETKETVQIPYGLCVWATGMGPSKLVGTVMEKFPKDQTNRRGILTDDKMRVKGASNIWALGDCATIEQKRLLNKIDDIFKEADSDKDGFLSYNDFHRILQKYSSSYPQFEYYGKKVRELFEEADVNKDGQLSIEEFKNVVAKVDSKIKMLPQTAQVASQEGRYLGISFNEIARGKPVTSFKYRHFGSLAYVGEETAVVDLPKRFVLSGFGAWWLWRSVYLSKQVSIQNKILVSFDWAKTLVFGRDITRN